MNSYLAVSDDWIDRPIGDVRIISRKSAAAMLRTHIKAEFGTMAEAARQWGMSRGHVCHVCAGRKPMSDEMAKLLGMREVKGVRLYEYTK